MIEQLSQLKNWEYVAAVAAITFLGILGKQVPLWLQARTDKTKSPLAAIDGIVQIYDVLNEVATELGTDRVLVLYTSNGGGIPTTKTPVYTTILYELVNNQTLHTIRSKFQQVLIDNGYARMLGQLMSAGCATFTYNQVPPGFLKELYKDEKIKYAAWYELLRTPDKYYFMSLRWADSAPAPEDIDLVCRQAQAKIKRILETH